ncbi:MAG: M15 family metallopeptidase, partial [Vampirovibrionia bacterium]
MNKIKNILAGSLILVLLQCFIFVYAQNNSTLPDGFCYLKEYIPNIVIDLRYKSDNNFLGRQVKGYKDAKCVLSIDASEALKNVQNDLNDMGLGLKVYDAYRPQIAVDDFVEWAKDINDTKMKQEYYPDV